MRRVIKVEGFANGAKCPIVGQYLKSFDFDAHGGQGDGVFTFDKAEAMTFESTMQAWDFWRTQSKVRPLRPDGKPNRPFTASSVTIEPV